MQKNIKHINGILLHILYGFRPMPQDMADSIDVQHVAMLHSCQSSNGSRTGSSSLILGKSSSSGSSARKLCQSLGRGGRTISPFSLRLIKTSSAFILRSLFSLLFLVGTKKGAVAPFGYLDVFSRSWRFFCCLGSGAFQFSRNPSKKQTMNPGDSLAASGVSK